MSTADHHWVTLHRLRFSAPISAHERIFPPVTGADGWRFCPSQQIGDNGLPTRTSDTWCGLGIWNNRAEATAVLAAPQNSLPWCDEAVEQWHCLAVPFAHRGEVNWRGVVEANAAIRPAANDPGGPLIVVTSAGFNSVAPDQIPRFVRFAKGVSDVIAYYGTLKENLRRDVFNGGFDGREGFTLSLWQDDAGMTQSAYHPGPHRDLMEQSRDGSLMDRSSFTRLRVVQSHGAWNGNPLHSAN